MSDAAVGAGVTPWVNLFRFTHPRWFAARGGFLGTANHGDFLRYVERVGAALAPHAHHFHVANESMVYVAAGYLMGVNPPFVKDAASTFAMTRHVLALHADAYRILKSLTPQPTVATIEVYLDPHPEDRNDALQRDAAQRFDAWYHGVQLEALATGWVRLPDREPEEIPHLRGHFHWTAVDSYEWHFGFGPERFGLIAFDPSTLERSVKASGRWMAELIASGVLDPSKIP